MLEVNDLQRNLIFNPNGDKMAYLTPAAVLNENLHVHRGKATEGPNFCVVQNENLHIHKGKGLEGVKAEMPKPVKNRRQERKALADIGKPVLIKDKSATTVLKDKSALTALEGKSKATAIKIKSVAPSGETDKKTQKSKILTDEDRAKCREWAKEGIEHMHFSGNDMHKFEAQQQEERVRKNVDKAMAGLQAWTDVMFGNVIPVKEVPSDSEDILKLEFEPEVLPPSPRINFPRKSGYEEIDDLFELDSDSLYFDRQFEFKLKEEYESDTACF